MSKEQQEAALQKAKDCAFNMYDVVDGEEVPWAKNKYEGDIGVKFFMEGWRQSISREGQEGGWGDEDMELCFEAGFDSAYEHFVNSAQFTTFNDFINQHVKPKTDGSGN